MATERQRRWRHENADRIADQTFRRRFRYDDQCVEYAAILMTDLCCYCGRRPCGEIDHIDPIARGGINGWNNLTSACRLCNGSKNATPLLLWLAR
ncbi:MAG: HNH endonuclease [Patescibacteria group bacterium]|nr:HNH endonuclease [Patescibacteria group bacterium]